MQIWIFKDSFCAMVVKISEDFLDLLKQVKSLKICWIFDHESNPPTESFQHSKDSDLRNLFKVRIHDHDMIQIHGYMIP